MRFQLALATKYMRGRKLRTFLTTLAIIIGVMVIFGMGILLPTMTDAFNKSLLAASGQTDVMITHKTGETFSATALNKIKTLDGIAAIGGSLERTINLPPGFYGKNSTVSALSLVGIDPAVAPEPARLSHDPGPLLEAGRWQRRRDFRAARRFARREAERHDEIADDPGRRQIGDCRADARPRARRRRTGAHHAHPGAETARCAGTHQRHRSESHDQRQSAERCHRQQHQGATGEHVHARRADERFGIRHHDAELGDDLQHDRFSRAGDGRVHHLQHLPHDCRRAASRHRHVARARRESRDHRRPGAHRRTGAGRHRHGDRHWAGLSAGSRHHGGHESIHETTHEYRDDPRCRPHPCLLFRLSWVSASRSFRACCLRCARAA